MKSDTVQYIGAERGQFAFQAGYTYGVPHVRVSRTTGVILLHEVDDVIKALRAAKKDAINLKKRKDAQK